MTRRMGGTIRRFLRSEDGATVIEYSLAAALVSAVILGTLSLVWTKLEAVYATVAGGV